jgi:hypothetical protein
VLSVLSETKCTYVVRKGVVNVHRQSVVGQGVVVNVPRYKDNV